MSIPQRRAAIPWWGHLLQPWFWATLFIGWYLWQIPSQWQYDSRELYRGCRNILDWFDGYGRMANPRPFPLFQYPSGIAALWAVEHGFNFNIYVFWSVCSQLSFGGILLVFHVTAQRLNRPALGWAAMVVMLSGPLLMYANGTFNEMVAAFLTLCFTAAAVGEGGPLVCGVLFWFSGITKETAPVLLPVIWLGAMWIRRSRLNRRQIVIHAIALLVAMVIALATNSAFNLLRFGAVWNRVYLQSHELVRAWPNRLQYCVALWTSPNGGVLIFWPTFAAIMIGTLVLASRSARGLLPAAVIAIALGGLTLGLSGWYQPFGWYAWGPRLMLPWLPACLLISLAGYPDSSLRWIGLCLGRRWAFALTAAVVCATALPHVMAADLPGVVKMFFDRDVRFPHAVSPSYPEEEYAQNTYLAWKKTPPMLMNPLLAGVTPLQGAEATLFLCSLVVILRKCRAALPS